MIPAGALDLGGSPTLGSVPTVPVLPYIYLPGPQQRPMPDVGFSFSIGVVTDRLFSSSLPLPSMVSHGLTWDWAYLLPHFGEAILRRLTFALLPHFMLCSCLVVAFPFLGLCRA